MKTLYSFPVLVRELLLFVCVWGGEGIFSIGDWSKFLNLTFIFHRTLWLLLAFTSNLLQYRKREKRATREVYKTTAGSVFMLPSLTFHSCCYTSQDTRGRGHSRKAGCNGMAGIRFLQLYKETHMLESGTYKFSQSVPRKILPHNI